MIFKKILLFFLFVMSTVCSGQIINQLVSTSGSSFNNGQIQLDWSLGEVAIHAYELNSFMLTEGFHQPRYVITSTEVIKAGPIVKLFPNPTIDQIVLEYPKELDGSVINLYDAGGSLILKSSIKHYLDMNNYQSGSYVIQIINEGKQIGIYNIQKL